MSEFKQDNISEVNNPAFNSFLLSLFLSLQIINQFLQIDAIAVLIILVLYITIYRKIPLQGKPIAFFLFLLSFFLVTKFYFNFGETTFTYMIFYCGYGFTALLLAGTKFDFKKLLYYTCVLYTVFSPAVVLLPSLKGEATMGEVYGYLFGFFCLLIYVFNKNYRPLSAPPVMTSVFFLTFLIYFFRISTTNTRGCIFSLIVFLVMYFIIIKSNTKLIVWTFFIIVLFLGILLYMYTYEIFIWIKSFLSSFNISLQFLDKSIYLLEVERFDHNRYKYFYAVAVENIKAHWLTGQGIAAFEEQTDLVYVHNVFLQILFEGGIILFLPIFFTLIKVIKWFFPVSKGQKDIQMFIVMLFCSCVPKLLFSSVFWREQKFILLLIILLVYEKSKVRKWDIKKLERYRINKK